MSNVNMYLKLKLTKGGLVKGAATADGHLEEILLDSIRWGEENSAALGGKSGSVSVRNFEFTKKMCPASVQILLACANCDVVQEAVISCRAANSTEKVDFLKWTMTDGVVSLYEMEAPLKDSGVPGERVRIRFRTLAVEFKPRTSDGKMVAGAMSARLDVAGNIATA